MAQITRDHDEIRQWVEDRNGRPAMVETGSEGGLLRIGIQEGAFEPGRTFTFAATGVSG